MKPTDEEELRVSADINGFLAQLRAYLKGYAPLEDDAIEQAHEDHSTHYNDTLDRGISLGERDTADWIRAIATQHGVAL